MQTINSRAQLNSVYGENLAAYHKGKMSEECSQFIPRGRQRPLCSLSFCKRGKFPDNYTTMCNYRTYYRIVNIFPGLLLIDKSPIELGKFWPYGSAPEIYETTFQEMRYQLVEL